MAASSTSVFSGPAVFVPEFPRLGTGPCGPVSKSRTHVSSITPLLSPSPQHGQLRVYRPPLPPITTGFGASPLSCPCFCTLDDRLLCTCGKAPLAITLPQSPHPLLLHLGSPASAVSSDNRAQGTWLLCHSEGAGREARSSPVSLFCGSLTRWCPSFPASP